MKRKYSKILRWFLILIVPSFALSAEPFGQMEGVRIENLEDGKVVILGKIHRPSDRIRLDEYLQVNPDVEDRTSFSKDAQAHVLARLKQLHPTASIRFEKDSFVVSGIESDRLPELQAIYPRIKIEKMYRTESRAKQSVDQSTVLLEIALVEVKKTALRSLGFRVDSPLGLSVSLRPQFEFVGDPIRAFLDLALRKGEARVHAKQSVVTQNGKEGEFLAGGEFPIRVMGRESGQLVFKDYGLILKFTPQLQGGDRVHIALVSEMSDIDQERAVEGIPALRKKLLKTQLYTKLGEMMAVGGIVRSDQANAADGIPGLSEIPILGRLFRSEAFRKEKSEAYIFITPQKLEHGWIPSPSL